MIAVDTSSWIAFLQGDAGADVDLLDSALRDRQVLMVPAVLTEILSDPKLSAEVSQTLSELPLIELGPGYWQRAGELRAKVLAKRRKARLGDALIAQSCIDRGIPLLTRDRDFRAFAGAAGLDILVGQALPPANLRTGPPYRPS
jgi:predicted nucleic acid-binding protein